MQPKAYIQETAIKTIQPVPEIVNKDQSFENTSNSSLLRVKKQNSNTNSNEHRNMLDSFEDGEKLEETKDEPKDLNIPKDFYQDNINPEFEIINSIYEKSYQKQKLPNKKRKIDTKPNISG